MDQSPQSGVPLNDAVGDLHLVTQGRQEDHQLIGVSAVGSHHQMSLLVLHQGGVCTDPCLKDGGVVF